MQFSKLQGSFPNVNTINTNNYRNKFDYTRWDKGTKITLVNVLWDSDYDNVVKFDSKEECNKWFNSIDESDSIILETNIPLLPDGTIKVPIPYDTCMLYNYLYIDVPMMPNFDNPVDYENKRDYKRWYFFINDVETIAANTTALNISLDVWTNFIYDTDINYMMLEQGHAPVAFSDTDAYLKNPINNNKYLLAPDVNFDNSSIVKDSKFIPFGNGEKYVCFACTANKEQIVNGSFGTVKAGSKFAKPTYSDTSDWYGKQLQVNNYSFGNGRNYSDLKTPVSMHNSVDNMTLNGTNVFAVKASDKTFLSDIAKNIPTFLRSIKAVFIVDENMITLGDKFTFCKHDMYACSNVRKNLGNYNLTKEMFGFDEKEQRFAKLFTYPYSYIEFSDNNGKDIEIHIEDTGSIGINMLTNIAFPILDCRMFLTGINGVGSNKYTWKRLDGSESDESIDYGDWGKYTIKLGIPTYAIYMDGETAWYIDEYNNSIEFAREKALTGYHNSVRSANLGYYNATTSADNAYNVASKTAKTAKTNEQNLASTANSNSVDLAGTVKTNADNVAYTVKSNTNNVAKTMRDNVDASILCNNANTQSANRTSISITANKNMQATNDTAEKNECSKSTTKIENETTAATTAASGFASIKTGAAQGAMTGASMGIALGPAGSAAGAVAMGIAGGALAAITAETNNSNASIITGANTAVTDATTNMNRTVTNRGNLIADTITKLTTANTTEQTNNNNLCAGKQADNNYNTTTTNAANNYNTDIGNNSRTYNTSVGNANRTYNTVVGNASRTCDTAISNADTTKKTSYANALRTDDIAIINAKEVLENTQDGVMYSMLAASKRNPIQLTQASGNAEMYSYGINGIQFRLRTQSESAIKQTVAQFARFGYNLNQIWNVKDTGLNLMETFTYWKVSDIWIDIRKAATFGIENALKNIFKNGVTVWKSPDLIGKVDIYDN
jgi:hypothetical protein